MEHRVEIRWRRADRKHTYYYGDTDTRFSVQIGEASEGGFRWLIFHTDFTGCFQAGLVATIEEGIAEAQQYLNTYAKPTRSP